MREGEEDVEVDLESLGLPFFWESPGSWASLELQDGAVIEALLEPLPGGNPRPAAVLGISARLGERLYSARYLHVDDLIMYSSLAYEGALCTTHGMRALKEFNTAFRAKTTVEEVEVKEPAAKSSGRRPGPRRERELLSPNRGWELGAWISLGAWRI